MSCFAFVFVELCSEVSGLPAANDSSYPVKHGGAGGVGLWVGCGLFLGGMVIAVWVALLWGV
jgi:hypothetical protein